MTHDLDINEEIEVAELIENPHLSYLDDDINTKRNVAFSISKRSPEDVLLINKSGLYIDSVFAGLREEHIEYIFKNSPIECKSSFLKILNNEEMLKDLFDVSKAMDNFADSGNQNQNRVRKILQYISDNELILKS